jgi:hypothetical protein
MLQSQKIYALGAPNRVFRSIPQVGMWLVLENSPHTHDNESHYIGEFPPPIFILVLFNRGFGENA